jgi:hypothetical protein
MNTKSKSKTKTITATASKPKLGDPESQKTMIAGEKGVSVIKHNSKVKPLSVVNSSNNPSMCEPAKKRGTNFEFVFDQCRKEESFGRRRP